MQYLTKKGIQHRDLKAHNCLIERDGGMIRVKLTDFGLSRSKALVTTFTGRASKNGPSGTVTHMAPEVLLKNEFTEKSDSYSFGIVMWEVLSRAVAFEGSQHEQIIAQVAAGMRPSPIPADSPPGLDTLMQECWDKEPFERPTFQRIVSDLQLMPGLQGSDSLPSHRTTLPLPPPIFSQTPPRSDPPRGSAGLSAPELPTTESSPASHPSSFAVEDRQRCDPRTCSSLFRPSCLTDLANVSTGSQ